MDYKESQVAGKSWQRAYRVGIENPYGEIPSILFYEEERVLLDTGSIAKHVATVGERMETPTESFTLINPETGAEIGTSTYQEAYLILASMYLHMANKRDIALELAAQQALENPPEV